MWRRMRGKVGEHFLQRERLASQALRRQWLNDELDMEEKRKQGKTAKKEKKTFELRGGGEGDGAGFDDGMAMKWIDRIRVNFAPRKRGRAELGQQKKPTASQPAFETQSQVRGE